MIHNIKKTPEESFQIVSRMLFSIVQLFKFPQEKIDSWYSSAICYIYIFDQIIK